MDQMLNFFTFNTKKMLELKGTKTIFVQKSTYYTKEATLTVTVTDNFMKLPHLLVFKDTHSSKIVTCEFLTYPVDCFYAWQKNAWMT